jgi:hypothetical protein
MARYRLCVQLIHWYEVIVRADSPTQAAAKAEALSPRRILARGKRVHIVTGLADAACAAVIESK